MEIKSFKKNSFIIDKKEIHELDFYFILEGLYKNV